MMGSSIRRQDESSGLTRSAVQAVGRERSGQPLPATLGQEQTWFLQQLMPESASNHLAVRARIRGPLDADALRRAIAAVHGRHEALRTAVGLRDGTLEQWVSGERGPALADHDLSSAPAARRTEIVRDLAGEELRRPFDLEEGPLARYHLVRLDSHNHELLVILHRLIADERSCWLVQRDLLAYYEAFVSGGLPDLPELAFQFTDHASWQRELLESEPARAQARYWTEALAALPDPVELPYANRRGTEPAPAGGAVPVPVSSGAWEALRRLTAAEATTPGVAAEAALAVYVHRLARRRDFVLGTIRSGRGRPGAEDVVGPFADVLPLRLRLRNDPTWREVLRLVRDVDAGARAHDGVPLRRLCELAAPARHLNMAPLAQVVVAPAPPAETRTAGGVTFAFAMLDGGETLYDVALELDEAGREPVCTLRYRRELFAPEVAEAMGRRLAALLEQMAAVPDEHLSNLATVTDRERDQVVVEWNQTRTDFPGERTIQSLFEDWADRTPDAPALRWEGFRMTYGQLERRANQVARYLRRQGVGLETRVGLYYGYSADWVIGALATLKAGGAYVPLDPSYPASRLAAMCEDSDVHVLLVQEGLDDRAELPAARRVVLSREAEAIDRESDARLPAALGSDALAYVMFTSGSTGRPKAIGNTHRNVTRTVLNTNYVKFGPTDIVSQASNISFDATTLELWGALLGGSLLVGLRKEDVLQAQRLPELLKSNGINIFFTPAALMKQLVSEAPGIFGSLDYFLSGGEQADYTTLRRLLDHGAPKHLINPYGPTETTVFCVTYECNGMTEAERHVPIGYPISNSTCYVLDELLQPVPAGVVGELFVGGPGVARGYLARPDLTAEKFVPDPYGDEPGGRLYSTGDLGRHRPDGMLEFLGREDRQIKLRGFRIEPAEIETCMLESGLVREVSVQVDRDRAGVEMLVAYVVPSGPDADLDALREHVRGRVPPYMLPAVFVAIPALPLNANGKLDARALRDFLPAARTGAELVEPRTATEGRLDGLWRDVIDVDAFSVHDDFFALGGTSMAAARLVARARTVFRCDIPLRMAFVHPTVASLAEAIDGLRSAERRRPAPAAAEPVAQAPVAATVAAPEPAPAAEVPSSDDTRDRLAEIWKEVLDIDELGPDDNFFAVGGHSLNANRAVSRAKVVFGREIPLRLLFQNPTLGAFATAIDGLDASTGAHDELRSVPVATTQSVDELMESVEGLSDEEIRRLLGS